MHVLKSVLGNEFPVDGNIIFSEHGRMRPGPKPKFTDLDVIALSLTAECMSIDSENYLFSLLKSNYKVDFPFLISRRQFNDRRKSLFPLTEMIRSKVSFKLNEINEVYAIDSMPLEICKLARESRNKMGKEHLYTQPDKGFCASQDKWFYGYKLHAACSPSGVIQSIDLSKASVHDIHYLKDVSKVFKNCLIVGDKGYISKEVKKNLWQNNGVCLETPPRSNQENEPKMLYVLKNIRKRIETVFSQLCDQFMIQRNYAKSFWGYKTRILAKVTGMTVLQYINKFIKDKPIGQIKYSFM